MGSRKSTSPHLPHTGEPWKSISGYSCALPPVVHTEDARLRVKIPALKNGLFILSLPSDVIAGARVLKLINDFECSAIRLGGAIHSKLAHPDGASPTLTHSEERAGVPFPILHMNN